MKWLLATVVSFLAVAAALPALAADAEPASDKVMMVAVGNAFPPFHLERDGKLQGFDVDLINAVAKAEGWSTNIRSIPFNGLIPSLQAGAIDVAISSITITRNRMNTVNFSDAYYLSGLTVLVRKDSRITQFSDIKDEVVGAQKGTSSVEYLLSHGLKERQIRRFDLVPTAYVALENGSVDAVLADIPVNIKYAREHPGVKIVGDLLTGEYFGMAIRKARPELVDVINDGLQKVRASGEYAALFTKWMEGDTRGAVNEVIPPQQVAK